MRNCLIQVFLHFYALDLEYHPKHFSCFALLYITIPQHFSLIAFISSRATKSSCWGKRQSRAAQDFVMSDFSLTIVLQFKISKIINGMAKVQIKSERITPFWRNFSSERAIFPFCRSGYRQSAGAAMCVVRLSVQRDRWN